jgi:hypothetical protein
VAPSLSAKIAAIAAVHANAVTALVIQLHMSHAASELYGYVVVEERK